MRLKFPTANDASNAIGDGQETLLDIRKIYVQEKAYEYDRTHQILQEYPDAEIISVDSHWKTDELNNNPDMLKNWTQVKAHSLVLGVKSSIATRPNGRSTDFIAPSIANGCTGACAYCYVARRKGYANPITTFVNIEKILAHIERKANKMGKKELTQACADMVGNKGCPVTIESLTQTCPEMWTFDIGENSDISIDAEISDNVYDVISLFRRLPHAKACFATKFVNPNLLEYDPQGHTRIRFSLMPSEVSKVVDVRTSPVEDRINAINDFVAAGYEVHINISPVIIYDGWQEEYESLLRQIDDTLNWESKRQLAAEVILLTHNEKLHHINMGWHPKAEEEYLWRHWDTPENKEFNKFGHKIIQQKKLSQNGMVNIRYKNKEKREALEDLTALMERHLPYCPSRYAF